MGYMTVQKHTVSQLCLLREPNFFSKAVFIAFIVGVLGIILVGSESYLFKIIIAFCATGLSFLIVDNYEICEFDKTNCELRLIRLHWFRYLLSRIFNMQTLPYVKARLDDITSVSVEEQGGNNVGKAYQVIVSLDTGVQLGITELFTTDDISEHEDVAKLIRTFLSDLPPMKADSEADDEGDELSSSEDDFEQISRSDLEGLQEVDEMNLSSVPLPIVRQETETSENVKDLANQQEDSPHDSWESPS